MSFTMSADKVVLFSRCDQFPETTIRKMFADHKADAVDLPTLAGLDIPLPVKVFLGLQDDFFTAEEFRDLAIAFAQRAANNHPTVATNHFVISALAAYTNQVSINRTTDAAAVGSHAALQVAGYRAAVKAMADHKTDQSNTLATSQETTAAIEAVWCAGYEAAGIACRNAASCAVAAVEKPLADAEYQWVLDTAVAKTKARTA